MISVRSHDKFIFFDSKFETRSSILETRDSILESFEIRESSLEVRDAIDCQLTFERYCIYMSFNMSFMIKMRFVPCSNNFKSSGIV